MLQDWIRNRSFRAVLLIGGLGIVLLFGLVLYGTTSYFQRKSEVATEVGAHADAIEIELLKAERAEKGFLLQGVTSPDFHEKGATAYADAYRASMAAAYAALDRLT